MLLIQDCDLKAWQLKGGQNQLSFYSWKSHLEGAYIPYWLLYICKTESNSAYSLNPTWENKY